MVFYLYFRILQDQDYALKNNNMNRRKEQYSTKYLDYWTTVEYIYRIEIFSIYGEMLKKIEDELPTYTYIHALFRSLRKFKQYLSMQ